MIRQGLCFEYPGFCPPTELRESNVFSLNFGLENAVACNVLIGYVVFHFAYFILVIIFGRTTAQK